MAEEKVEFELVTPERLLLSESVDMVVVPGSEGNFGVLARHAPMISALRPGVIDICAEGRSVSERMFVAGGFAEVTNERCTVLAEEALRLEDIERSDVEQQLKDAREDLADAETDKQRAEAERRLAVGEAKLRAVGD